MTNPPLLVVDNVERDFNQARASASLEQARRKRGGPTGGGPTDDDVERRFAALESSLEKIDVKLDRLLASSAAVDVRLATMEIKIDTKATQVDLAGVDQKVAIVSTKLDSKSGQADLSEIRGKIDKFVDKWFVLKTCFWMFGAVSGVITTITIFQNQIRAALGVH